jgi:predicted transposase YdaD
MNTEHGDRYMYALIKHQISPNLYMSFRMIKFAIAAMDSAKIVFIAG